MKLGVSMFLGAVAALVLAGCAEQPGPATDAPPAGATTVEDFDTSTVASLGNPSRPGFWLETPLVSVPTKGRMLYLATGKSVVVDLIPTDDATGGSRISLAALRLLGAALTGLPELIVYAG
jgi:uncharacterized lipoprotein YajG